MFEKESFMLSQEIKDKAFRILDRRDYSVKELTDKLAEKGEAPEAAAECAAWLESLGILDDGRYAGEIVRHYFKRGYGAGRIRSELFKRGIPRELWEEALSGLPDENKVLDRLAAEKINATQDRKELKRFTDMLLRRGFSWEDIKEALERNRAGRID